jgi:LmbE family N-acetylglucosaminyl deacetylase
MNRVLSLSSAALLLAAMHPVHAQERGAAQLHALVNGLTVTPRVLIIGARPGDADADLIAWLARGHHIQTGYLSLTRGESATNYTGLESGATLGAIHVQEALAARRIDGGAQFFTGAYDFGPARNTAEVFRQWSHARLLGDVVAIVRAFRPQVIMARFRADTTDRDGQHAASAVIAREVFDAATDTVQFPTMSFGMPWSPSSVYEPGGGVSIDSHEYDRVLGRSYADIAAESRAQLRSFGLVPAPWEVEGDTQWRRIAARGADSAATADPSSIFSGIDTSFARLQKTAPGEVIGAVRRELLTQVPGILAYADSARAALDLERPTIALPYLMRVVEFASSARVLLRSCRHPTRDAAASLSNTKCQPEWLDLDASLDLVLQRATDAVLAASGVTFSAVADREFLAGGDTAHVTITVVNNGDAVVRLNDVSVTGAIPLRMTEPIRIAAHGSARVMRSVTNATYANPWWIAKRDSNFYPPSVTALDGVPRPAIFLRDFLVSSVAVPENIRRLSDATVTLTMGVTTLTSSIGAVVFRTADPVLGARDNTMSGVPAVTLSFARALEWAQAGKVLKKPMRATLRSFSDVPQRVALRSSSRRGAVRLDSLPPSVVLAPHETREVWMQLRGTPDVATYDLELAGIAPSDTFDIGFRTLQYSYLPPIHYLRQAALRVQAVDVEIPNRLTVAYVRGAGDEADVALKQLGVPAYVFNAEGLTRFDLEGISTVVIGPSAFRVDPGLLTQMPRLTEFARKGGTVLVLSNPDAIVQPGVLPFPVGYARPFAEQVTQGNTPVMMIEPRARLLTWPNVITGDDWLQWVGARAPLVPTTVDARYAFVVETHDPEQRENRNSILVATVGKGRVIYTSLTLTEQIANGVPGAMRLFVNLLSAGLTAETKVAKSESK